MPFSFHKQPLSTSLDDLINALAKLQATVTKLHQQNQSLQVHQQAAIELYERYQSAARFAHRLRQSLNSTEILNQTVVTLQDLLKADRAVIYQLQADEAIAVSSQQRYGGDHTLQPLDRMLVRRWVGLYREAEPLVFDNPQQSSFIPTIARWLQQQQVQAMLAVPIFREENLFGWLCIQQCDGDRTWQQEEIEITQQLVAEAVIALQQSDLYQQAQQINADLERQVERRTEQLQTALRFESMLKRITDKVRDSLDGNQILQTAVKELTLVLDLGGCNAALYDLDQGTSTIRYEFTQSIPTSQGRVAQMDDFPEIYECLKQGQYLQFCSLLPNPDRGRVAMLACPIFVDSPSSQGTEPEGMDQGVLGDLWLIHQEDHIFQEFEVRLVQQVANQCAIAIRQAQLYQTAQKQVQELEKLNRLKDDFLSTVSHELRTPITNVKMAVKMLRIATTEEKRQRYLDILDKEANREATLIDDLLDLQRLEASSSPVELEPIHLATWISSLVEPFQSRFFSRQQTFQLAYSETLPVLMTNEAMLRRILAELLNNACKYTASGGTICLKIESYLDHLNLATLQSDAGIIIQVSNQAKIGPSELPKIFEKFYRCPHADPWSQGGTGLGLALVQKLVEQLQGTIEAHSFDDWTTFTVILPVIAPKSTMK
jgi:signal transduction histidine kinase